MQPILNNERRGLARRSASPHASTLKTYGMSVADYNAALARQDGLCPICLKRSEQKLCVNHDHKTRRRRALLCLNCNVGLGRYKDDPAAMRRGADYLEHWQREQGPRIPERRPLPARSAKRRRRAASRPPRKSSVAS